MSVNRYNSTTGELTSLATGSRTWVGTREAYDQAKTAGTLPNNCLIAITDDEKDHNHYSTSETLTGMYWIDGKPIYRKVIDFGTLPNATSKSVAHNISNLSSVITLRGIASESNSYQPIPYATPTSSSSIKISANNTNVSIETGSDRRSYSAKIILEYTKTTD